jgi:hypothetical protein
MYLHDGWFAAIDLAQIRFGHDRLNLCCGEVTRNRNNRQSNERAAREVRFLLTLGSSVTCYGHFSACLTFLFARALFARFFHILRYLSVRR